jgi:hypothetical protein
MGVLLEEGIGCQLAGLAAGSAEEIAVDVFRDAGLGCNRADTDRDYDDRERRAPCRLWC